MIHIKGKKMETITFYAHKESDERRDLVAYTAAQLSLFSQDVCVMDFDLQAQAKQHKLVQKWNVKV